MREIERLIDQLGRQQGAPQGGPWHGRSRTEILAAVSAEQAARRVLPGAHTIWEIVLHLTAWTGEVELRLRGEPSGTPPAGDWPATPGRPDDAAWAAARARLDAAHASLVVAARELGMVGFDTAVVDTRGGATGPTMTRGELLYGALQHDVYHTGQIAILAAGMAQ